MPEDAADEERPVIRATYELEPHGSAEALAVQVSTGVPDGPDFVRGRVLSEGDGVAVLELPASNWGADVTMLVSSLVAGAGTERAAFTRCRLVDLELPDGLLPGPCFGPPDRPLVGAVVQPSLGLSPTEHAAVVAALFRAGADLVKDDDLLGDPDWCGFDERVAAVTAAVPREATYCPNVSGPIGSLLHRAERAVELGATGLMVNAFAQGLDAVRLLRDADFGVPLLASRVGSGPWVRNEHFGVAGHVLALLTRLCGADCVSVGAFGGKRFDTDDEVRANVEACRRPLPGRVPASVVVLGGGLGPDDARAQAEAAGWSGTMVLLGSAAFGHPGGAEAAVRATVEALA